MRKLYTAIISGFLALTCGSSSYAQDSSLPLASLGNFVYKGAFKMDYKTVYGDSDNQYASAIFELSSDKKSFFFGGRKVYTTIGQFLLPELVKSDEMGSLNTAPVIQNQSSMIGSISDDPQFEGKRIPTGNPQKIDRITGIMLRKDNKLVANVTKYYDADAHNTHSTMLIADPSDLANTEIYGFFSYEGAAHMSGWMSEIPDEWKSELGGDYISGWANNLPIISRNSVGPSAFVVDFDQISPTTSTDEILPTTVLMDFSLQNPLHPDKYNNQETIIRNNQNQDTVPIIIGTNDLWTMVSWAVYGFIIPNTRTYAVFGSSGGHESGIGYKIQQLDQSSNCPGPCANDRFDYYNYYWLFDLNDLVAVKNGEIKPYEVRPYDYGKFPAPFQTSDYIRSLTPVAIRPIRGGDFDTSSNTLYLVLGGSLQEEQIVIAYDVLTSGQPKTSSPPKSTTLIVE
jgi:hypothetical protein